MCWLLFWIRISVLEIAWSCVLGKGEGCVVFVCGGMEVGEVGEYGEELFRCSLSQIASLASDNTRTELGQ